MSENGRPLTRDSAIDSIDALRTTIRALEVKHRQAGDDAAAAEAYYRLELAKRYREYRNEGRAQDEANTLARGDVVEASEERDRTAYRVKHLAEVIEDRRGERASLNRLIDLLVAET